MVDFQAQGYDVSHFDWGTIRETPVDEYSDGDMADGYIVYPYDSELYGRVSYPKFQTPSGTYVSLKYGAWDPKSGTYDSEHVRFINVPVLKTHSVYGVTACVKDYMGVVTGVLSTNSHSAIRYGILGALLGDIQLADLNILDCIWINANPYTGPYTGYGDALRRDELVASVDPIAADIWAVKNILIPGFYEEGFTPPWPYPSADPDDPDSDFREYLDKSVNYILTAGYDVTNDLQQIDAFTWNGAGDADGDSDVDLADYAAFYDCLGGPGAPAPPGCEDLDFNANDEVDMNDFTGFQSVFTGPGIF